MHQWLYAALVPVRRRSLISLDHTGSTTWLPKTLLMQVNEDTTCYCFAWVKSFGINTPHGFIFLQDPAEISQYFTLWGPKEIYGEIKWPRST